MLLNATWVSHSCRPRSLERDLPSSMTFILIVALHFFLTELIPRLDRSPSHPIRQMIARRTTIHLSAGVSPPLRPLPFVSRHLFPLLALPLDPLPIVSTGPVFILMLSLLSEIVSLRGFNCDTFIFPLLLLLHSTLLSPIYTFRGTVHVPSTICFISIKDRWNHERKKNTRKKEEVKRWHRRW